MNTKLKLMAVAVATVGLLAGSYAPSMAGTPIEEHQRIVAELAQRNRYVRRTAAEEHQRIVARLALQVRYTTRAVANPLQQHHLIVAQLNQSAGARSGLEAALSSKAGSR